MSWGFRGSQDCKSGWNLRKTIEERNVRLFLNSDSNVFREWVMGCSSKLRNSNNKQNFMCICYQVKEYQSFCFLFYLVLPGTWICFHFYPIIIQPWAFYFMFLNQNFYLHLLGSSLAKFIFSYIFYHPLQFP